MLIKILIGVAALIVLLAIVVAMQPGAFRIVRLARMMATPAAVFARVNDFHLWPAWSPWEKIDPALKRTYSGAPSGVGAVYAWEGNKEVGSGRMTITESRPSELIRIKLEFLKPFVATNVAEFTFKPSGEQTEVAWAMAGDRSFMFKAVGLFMNMDKMIGGQFEKGLTNLKTIVEAPQA